MVFPTAGVVLEDGLLNGPVDLNPLACMRFLYITLFRQGAGHRSFFRRVSTPQGNFCAMS